MNFGQSSEYTRAMANLLNEYFSYRGWVITPANHNRIFVYLSSPEPFNFTNEETECILAEASRQVPATGLQTSSVTYMFFQRGELVQQIFVPPGSEFDV
jgi:hypothetical protein